MKFEDQLGGEMNPISKRDIDGITTEGASAIKLGITCAMHKGDAALCGLASRYEVNEILIRALIPKKICPQTHPMGSPSTRPDHSVVPMYLFEAVAVL
jgi:hypothetical protein